MESLPSPGEAKYYATPAYAGDDGAVRLAVLAEDVSSESRALADLLTADLSKDTGIQIVERSLISLGCPNLYFALPTG